MSELSAVTNAGIRKTLGNRCFTSGVLAVDGTNVENVQTTAAVVHCVNGVFQTDYAAIAEIDLSAIAVIDAKTGTVLSAAGASSATKAHPALAAGDDVQTIVYVLACKGIVTYIVEATLDVAAAQDDATYELECPAGFAPFGVIKITQTPTASVGVAAFQLGVDDLTGITGRAAAFYNVSVLPATVAELVTV